MTFKINRGSIFSIKDKEPIRCEASVLIQYSSLYKRSVGLKKHNLSTDQAAEILTPEGADVALTFTWDPTNRQ